MKSVFFGDDYITITKQKEVDDWALLKPEIFAVLMDYLQSGKPILNEGEMPKSPEDTGKFLRVAQWNIFLLRKESYLNLIFLFIYLLRLVFIFKKYIRTIVIQSQ